MQHDFSGFKHKDDFKSLTIEVKTQNSTDLSSGPRPKSKSVEFFVFTSTAGELLRCEKQAFHFHAAPFGIRSLGRIWSSSSDVRLSEIVIAINKRLVVRSRAVEAIATNALDHLKPSGDGTLGGFI